MHDEYQDLFARVVEEGIAKGDFSDVPLPTIAARWPLCGRQPRNPRNTTAARTADFTFAKYAA
jgi:hypothetical protein